MIIALLIVGTQTLEVYSLSGTNLLFFGEIVSESGSYSEIVFNTVPLFVRPPNIYALFLCVSQMLELRDCPEEESSADLVVIESVHWIKPEEDEDDRSPEDEEDPPDDPPDEEEPEEVPPEEDEPPDEEELDDEELDEVVVLTIKQESGYVIPSISWKPNVL